jgi:hypothetical protein
LAGSRLIFAASLGRDIGGHAALRDTGHSVAFKVARFI